MHLALHLLANGPFMRSINLPAIGVCSISKALSPSNVGLLYVSPSSTEYANYFVGSLLTSLAEGCVLQSSCLQHRQTQLQLPLQMLQDQAA